MLKDPEKRRVYDEVRLALTHSTKLYYTLHACITVVSSRSIGQCLHVAIMLYEAHN